jgi:hypothetical protein
LQIQDSYMKFDMSFESGMVTQVLTDTKFMGYSHSIFK